MTTLAVVVATGLFVIQIIASVLRRDRSRPGPGAQGPADRVRGQRGRHRRHHPLARRRRLPLGRVRAGRHGRFHVGRWERRSSRPPPSPPVTNPAVALLLALIVLGAVIVVWGAMMVRKLLIIVAAVFAPLAFAGATSDISTSWVRKWIETMVALIVSKLILVIIFVIGLGVLTDGLGEVNGIRHRRLGDAVDHPDHHRGADPLDGRLRPVAGHQAGPLRWRALRSDPRSRPVRRWPAPRPWPRHLAKRERWPEGSASLRTGGSGTSLGARSGPGGSGTRDTERVRVDVEFGHPAFARGRVTRRRHLRRWRLRPASGAAAAGPVGAAGAAAAAASAAKTAVDNGTGHIADVSSRSRPDRHRPSNFPVIDLPAQRQVTSRWVTARCPPARRGSGETCAAVRCPLCLLRDPRPCASVDGRPGDCCSGCPPRAVCRAGAAVCVVVLGLVAGGGIGLVASGLVWVPLLAATFVTWQGLALCEWVPVVGHWNARKVARQSEYRARVSVPRPAGTMALPGDAAALRFYEDPESGACMVHDPHRQSLSVTVAVTHPAYVLLSAGDQQSRVSAWGRLLASLSKSGYCAAIQVLEATVPDPGTGVAGWYERRGTHDGGWADTNYAALLRSPRTARPLIAPPSPSRSTCAEPPRPSARPGEA